MSTTEEPVALRCARDEAKLLHASLEALEEAQRRMDVTPATSEAWGEVKRERDMARLMVVEAARLVSRHLEKLP